MSADGWSILFVGSALLNLYLIARLIKASDRYKWYEFLSSKEKR